MNHRILTSGTSNAAALTTRAAHFIADALDDLYADDDKTWHELKTRAVMLKTLLAHARNCGVGASMTFLVKQARNVARLMTVSAPDRLVLDLARYRALDPDCGITGVHLYPLGGLRRTAAWGYAVAEGAFTLKPDGRGITLDRPID